MKLKRIFNTFLSFAAILAALALVTMPTLANGDVIKIVFASGPDDTGTVQRIVENFNAEHADRIQVVWRVMNRNSNLHHEQLVSDFSTKVASPHVIASDVVWTAEFAKNGWVKDLTKRFYREYDRDAFLIPALETAAYRLRIWGVPWYSDAGILFYRKDSLAKSGFDAPPRTWDELIHIASQVKKDSGINHGFVFQGAEYEGGAANAAEYIWSAGGELMKSELRVTSAMRGTLAEVHAVTIKSKEAASGLDVARRLITEGIAPVDVKTYREKEALDVFLAGDAVFLRSWPYVYGLLETSKLSMDQVGIASIPAMSTGHLGYSCLGGWNLMMNARASKDEQTAAWEFIRHMTSTKQQKRTALEAGLLPVLVALYEDPEVLEGAPVVALAKETMSSRIRARPKTPFYYDMSLRIASVFQRVLEGKLTGANAVDVLDKDLRIIATRNR